MLVRIKKRKKKSDYSVHFRNYFFFLHFLQLAVQLLPQHDPTPFQTLLVLFSSTSLDVCTAFHWVCATREPRASPARKDECS